MMVLDCHLLWHVNSLNLKSATLKSQPQQLSKSLNKAEHTKSLFHVYNTKVNNVWIRNTCSPLTSAASLTQLTILSSKFRKNSGSVVKCPYSRVPITWIQVIRSTDERLSIVALPKNEGWCVVL